MASGQQLTEKCGTKSAVWKYFGLIADDSGGGSQQDNPVCRICGVQVRAATGNTSNLLSHLKNKHPKVHSEVRLLICPSERLFSSSGHIVNSLRGNLNPEKVNMLVFLNNNLTKILAEKNLFLSLF